jgi:hypothetical protein
LKSVFPGRFVIRSYEPLRPWLLFGASFLLALLAAWLMYEFGRRTAGFDALRAGREQSEMETQIEKLERQQREMRVQLAAGEEDKLAQVRERAELAHSIGELQAQLSRAQQDLQFYRGIANPQLAQDKAVAIQQFSVLEKNAAEHRYALRFTLGHDNRSEESASGNLGIVLDGIQAGVSAAFELAAISDAKAKQIPFNFRYFANFEHPVTLPAGFVPQRVTLEIRPGRAGVSPYRQTFVWNLSGK